MSVEKLQPAHTSKSSEITEGNGSTRSNGETEIKRRERHPGEAGHSAGRRIERRRNSQAAAIDPWLVIAAPLYPIRAKRVTGMASFVLRVSVSLCHAVPSADLRSRWESEIGS